MPSYPSRIRRFDYTDILGWSYSRYDLFQQCKRKYYFHYYRKFDIANVVKISALRELTSVPLEIGNITHKMIKRLLRRLKLSGTFDMERFWAYVERETLDICRQKTFEDVYYGSREERQESDFQAEILSQVQMAVQNFLESDRFRWINEVALETRDEWFIEPEKKEDKTYGECRIDNLKALCTVDFMFPINDEIYIIDWKTGKQDYRKHSTQLRGYAGWANFHFDKDYSKINTTIAYLLPNYSETTVALTEFDLDEFRERVREQTEEMYSYCAEPELNKPLPKDVFEMTQSQNFCKFCNYRELCDRN